MTVRHSDPGVLPGMSDALRALMTTDPLSAWQLPDSEVVAALGVLGRVRQLLEVAEVALVREGLTRGLPTTQSWSDHDWVGACEGSRAPRPAHGHVASVVRVARAGLGRGGSLTAVGDALAATETDRGSADGTETDVAESGGSAGGVAALVEAFGVGDLPLGKADQLVRFEGSVRRVADPALLEADLGILLGQARDDVICAGSDQTVSGRVHGLDENKLAAAITMTSRMLRPERDQESLDDQQRASRTLTKSSGPCGMTRYKVLMDPEGAAIIDAALAGLSQPVPGADGALDTRSPARRSADALVTIVERGVSSPGEEPTSSKAQVMVTISLSALLGDLSDRGLVKGCDADAASASPGPLGRRGVLGQPWVGRVGGVPAATPAGHVGGVTATGQVLSPAAVRRLACEAEIIPVVLGRDSEPLELGRAARYFTPGQRRALWLRDGGCTYPGCTMPAHWSDAHHVDWWRHGGRTDISNAALLCERHHTKVHRYDLTATITDHGVTWHL